MLNDCLVTLSGATKLCLGLSISIVMTFSCIKLLVLPEVTATNFSKDPLVACDQISSVKESSTPGIIKLPNNVHINSLNALKRSLSNVDISAFTKCY